MTARGYATPQALRQAVTARLRALSVERPETRLGDLLRQFAYDRLLARVFSEHPERWVLKGATAMLARYTPGRPAVLSGSLDEVADQVRTGVGVTGTVPPHVDLR